MELGDYWASLKSNGLYYYSINKLNILERKEEKAEHI